MWASRIRASSVSPYPEGQGGGGKGLRESAAKDIFMAGGRSMKRTRQARSVSEMGYHRAGADGPEQQHGDGRAREHPRPPRPDNPPAQTEGEKSADGGKAAGGQRDVRIQPGAKALPAAPRGGGGGGISPFQTVQGRVPTPAVKGGGDGDAADLEMSAVPAGGGGRGGAAEGRTDSHSHAFVGFTKPNKFGRSWGEFNPRNEAVVRGVNPRQKLLESYGRSACPERTKDNFAQLIDRRSGQLAFRDRTGTLHSMLSITAADPYHKNTKTTSPFAVGRFEDAKDEGVIHGTPQQKKKAEDGEKRTKKLWGKGTMKAHIPLLDHVNEGADRDAGGVTHNASAGGLDLQVAKSTQSLARDMFERLRDKPQTVLQIYKAGHEVRYKAIKRSDLPGGVFTQTLPDWYHRWNGGDYDMKDCSKYAMHHKHFGGYIPIKVLQHEYRPVSLTNYS